ncbi:hypothetical protein [Dishui lake virophage 1]|nr:hypothetical protein [Dishui lake virophage 1]
MESIMKNVGMCLDLGGEGKGYVFGEWNLERKQEFLQSILGGFGMKANVREDGGFGGVMCAEAVCAVRPTKDTDTTLNRFTTLVAVMIVMLLC